MTSKLWLMALLVALLPAAAAQGPAPGHADAASYARHHAYAEAKNASADPVDHAEAHASPEGLQGGANHTLYVACWAADDHGIQHDACDPYYTPRGQAAPEQPSMHHNGTAAANATLNATAAFAGEAVDALNDTLADPGAAPSQTKQRIIAAATGFLGDVADVVAGAVEGMLDGGLGVAQASADAVLGAGEGLAAGSAAATGGLHAGAGAATDATAQAGRATASAISKAVQAAGGAVAAAGSATAAAGSSAAGALGDAAKTVGHGVAGAAKSAGGAIADAASHLRDAVAGILHPPNGSPAPEAPRVPEAVGLEGLLDGPASLLGQ